MELTERQKTDLYEDGFVLLPGVVPQERVKRALRAINSSLGLRGMSPGDLPRLRAQSYCPELQTSPEIVGLLTETAVWSAAESAIGRGKIRPITSAQIALRFPTMEPPRAPEPHLDGMYTPTNGVPEGVIANFTALIGIFLSDVPGDFAGNLSVWPGTHRLYERYFQQHGAQALLEGMPPIELPESGRSRRLPATLCSVIISWPMVWPAMSRRIFGMPSFSGCAMLTMMHCTGSA